MIWSGGDVISSLRALFPRRSVVQTARRPDAVATLSPTHESNGVRKSARVAEVGNTALANGPPTDGRPLSGALRDAAESRVFQ